MCVYITNNKYSIIILVLLFKKLLLRYCKNYKISFIKIKIKKTVQIGNRQYYSPGLSVTENCNSIQ